MKISVIIPVYNAEKYIRRCIESILPQDIFEIVIVNDGSQDNSGAICEEYVKQDSRIKVFNQVNQGVSAARNLALEEVTGDWIAFVDADDWVEPNWSEVISENINKLPLVDVFVFGINIVNHPSIKKLIPDGHIKTINDYVYLSFFPYGVCYLFRTQIIKKLNIKFPVGVKLSEDQCFIYKYLSVCSIVATIDKALYNYFTNESSAVNLSAGKEITVNSLLAANDFLEFAIINNINSHFCLKVVSGFYEEFFHYYILSKDKSQISKKYRKIYIDTLSLLPDFKKNKHFRLGLYNLKIAVWIHYKIKKIKTFKRK